MARERLVNWLPIAVAIWVAAGLSQGCGDSRVTGVDEPTVNRPPAFAAAPPRAVVHDSVYTYEIAVSDPDGDVVTVRTINIPSWLSFDAVNLVLSGIAGEENIGEHQVELAVSDGMLETRMSYTLTVDVGLSSLIFEGSWISRTPHYFGHDGQPYESEHFAVYSGFASQEARSNMADVAEESFAELKAALQIVSETELDFGTSDRTIDIFAMKHQGEHVHWTGWAYSFGFLAISYDSPRYEYYGFTPELYKGLVKHELMHVVEFLLIGVESSSSPTDVWFREGMAEHLAGLNRVEVRTREHLLDWMDLRQNLRGQGNPIGIHEWRDFPPEILAGPTTGTYYPYFELAVYYLVDPAGHGKTIMDLKGIYRDLRTGKTFAESFEDRMGMSLDYYEENFFDLLLDFLPEGSQEAVRPLLEQSVIIEDYAAIPPASPK